MSNLPMEMSGTVHGNSIDFDQSVDLPDGLKVRMVVSPASQEEAKPESVPPGLLRAFGAWADESEEVDKFLAECRELRRLESSRRELDP